MKDIVQDRLSKMEDLQQRRMLKNLMTGVFLNLVEYQEELNQKLERRVFDEVHGDEGMHDVIAALCSRDEVDPVHEFLYPILPEDAEPPLIDMKGIVEALSQQQEIKLTTIFLQCEHSRIASLLADKREFKGEIVTSKGNFQITVRLQKSLAYQEQVEKLYHVFLTNSLPWRTINHPYLHKFVDVMLVSCEGELDDEDQISEVTIHLEEYEPFKRLNMVPLWNIQQLELRTGGFPIPASDRVNFEHVLPLRKLGTQHGYLVDADEKNIRYIKRTQEEITIVSPHESSENWKVLKLAKPTATALGKLDYEILSNGKTDGFIGKYRHRQAQNIRSRSEVARIIHSYEASKLLELVDLVIQEAGEGAGITYDMNGFVSDQVRAPGNKLRMIMRFNRREGVGSTRHDFVLEDMMSFLVSEIQMSFPEYKCEGEWA